MGQVIKPVYDTGQKKCNRCDEWKSTKDFYQYRRKLKSGVIAYYYMAHCKLCHVKYANKYEKRAFRENPEEWRRRKREQNRRQRAKKNALSITYLKFDDPVEHTEYLSGRIPRSVFIRELEAWQSLDPENSIVELGIKMGISDRRIRAVINGGQSTTKRIKSGMKVRYHNSISSIDVDFMERFMIAMGKTIHDLPEWDHIPPISEKRNNA